MICIIMQIKLIVLNKTNNKIELSLLNINILLKRDLKIIIIKTLSLQNLEFNVV